MLDINSSHIFVVDDDQRLRSLVQRYLIRQGYWCSYAEDGIHAQKLMQMLRFDLIVMDIMMPGIDGITLTNQIRQSENIPIIILSAKNEVDDRINGLNSGADDFLPKPFEPSELIARIEAVLRRSKAARPSKEKPVIEFGEFKFNIKDRLLRRNDRIFNLTELDKKLLLILAQSPNRAVSRDHLMRRMSDEKEVVQDRAIDVRISRLREKIENDAKHPNFLLTIRNEGYMLVANN